ncbi:MAG: START domain-containing protein [Bacteroidota bacterium]
MKRSNWLRIGLIMISGLFISTCFSQSEWTLKKDKNGIKVFTGKLADSKFNAIKVSCNLNANLSSLASLLLQPHLQPEWVIATKTSKLIKQLAPNHIYYYNIATIPWPLANRDMVIDLKIVQDSASKKMTVTANTIENILPAIKGLERIPYTHATWEVTPIGPNQIHVEYFLKINPGGGVPPWILNMFIAKAPFDSFDNLSRIIQEKRFQNQKLEFIRN